MDGLPLFKGEAVLRLYEIYRTTFPNGKFYTGQHLMPEGKTEHPYYLGSGIRFTRCLNKYGAIGVVKQQLAIVPTKRLADILEVIFIGFDKGYPNCLNITDGGEGSLGCIWAHNGKTEMIIIDPQNLPKGFSLGRLPYTEKDKLASKEKTTQLWQDPEFRKKTLEGMKKHPHGPLSVPIHNKGKTQYSNGIDQIYLQLGDSVPDGYTPGGLPRPDREFKVTEEFRNKVSLNNNRTVFYKIENAETNEIYFMAGTTAIGKFLGVSAGQVASVLCRGLCPKRGQLFNIFSEWKFDRISKEDYLQRAT
jgi:hypothetical protein